MKQCEICGTLLPREASFCGKCGHAPSPSAYPGREIDDLPTRHLESAGEATMLTPSGKLAFRGSPSGPLRPLTLLPFANDEEDEEQKRRRAARFGLALPLVGGLADQQPLGQIPSMQGTPQMAHIPGMQGTPLVQGSIPSAPGTPAVASGPPPGYVPSGPPPPHLQPPPSSGQQGGSPGGSQGGAPGCLTIAAILIASVVIILTMIIGLGLTVLAPSLVLSGSPDVAPGGTMSLHGTHFLPHSSVTLTLDGGTPLYALQPLAAPRLALGGARYASAGTILLAPEATNVVPVQGDGTFTILFQVNPSWLLGQHIVHATESVSHRSASLSFTIIQPSASVTPTPLPTATPTPTPTPTPTAVPPAPPVLSCILPGKLTLGPLSAFSSQTSSGTVTLCTSGSGTLTWQASWDQKKAPWLHMNRSSGSILAPGQFQATISASSANLAAGTYTATVTFIELQSGTIEAVTVNLTVQASCLRVGPLSMSFDAGFGSNPNPDTQNISLTNCGLVSDWSATATTSDGNNWLSISPSKGTLKATVSGQITVSINSTTLAIGTYTGTVTIKLGATTVAVTVTLNVSSVITASPNPVNPTCTTDPNGNSTCSVTLMSSPGSASLSWSAGANQTGVSIQPSNGNIPPGGSATVTLVFSICTTTTVTFSGPVNSAAVVWNCTPIG